MMEQLEIKQTLGDVGVDYDKGLERFMGNVALYHKFLVKFLDDSSYADFTQSFADGDIEKAGKCVHTLKGTADKMVQAIRAGKSREELTALAADVKEVYEKNCEAIRKTVG